MNSKVLGKWGRGMRNSGWVSALALVACSGVEPGSAEEQVGSTRQAAVGSAIELDPAVVFGPSVNGRVTPRIASNGTDFLVSSRDGAFGNVVQRIAGDGSLDDRGGRAL